MAGSPAGESSGWGGLGDIGAVASIVGLAIVLAVAPAARILIAATISILVIAFLWQRYVLTSTIERLTVDHQAAVDRVDNLEVQLRDSPRYDYVNVLNEVKFTIDPVAEIYTIDHRRIFRNNSNSNLEFIQLFFLCNRYPLDPEEGRHYYAANPVGWAELDVHAFDGQGNLDVELLADYNNRKDYAIKLEHHGVPSPLGPGEAREVHYGYKVPFRLWGSYFDRPIDQPTERLRVHIVCPRGVRLLVGVSRLARSSPRTAVNLHERISEDGSTCIHTFEVDHPDLGTAYQFTWDYVGADHTDVTVAPPAHE
jgi:hypothetical protein